MIAFLQLLWALINFTRSFEWGTVLIICSDHLLTDDFHSQLEFILFTLNTDPVSTLYNIIIV